MPPGIDGMRYVPLIKILLGLTSSILEDGLAS
jgi:hypothetical protein